MSNRSTAEERPALASEPDTAPASAQQAEGADPLPEAGGAGAAAPASTQQTDAGNEPAPKKMRPRSVKTPQNLLIVIETAAAHEYYVQPLLVQGQADPLMVRSWESYQPHRYAAQHIGVVGNSPNYVPSK